MTFILNPETQETLQKRIIEAAEIAFGEKYVGSRNIRITFPIAVFADFTVRSEVWYKQLIKFRKQIQGITVLKTGYETTGPQVDFKLVLKTGLLSVRGIDSAHVEIKASIQFREAK